MIETKRLLFRPWQASDARELFQLASDPDVGPRAGWPPHQSVEESLEIIRTVFNSDHVWALVLKESNRLIGCMGYYDFTESNIGIEEGDAEVGSLRAMIDYCFNTKGFITLWADHFVENPASGNVMEKCGFRDTGETNWLSNLYRGDERPVKIMRLDYAL